MPIECYLLVLAKAWSYVFPKVMPILMSKVSQKIQPASQNITTALTIISRASASKKFNTST